MLLLGMREIIAEAWPSEDKKLEAVTERPTKDWPMPLLFVLANDSPDSNTQSINTLTKYTQTNTSVHNVSHATKRIRQGYFV